MTRNYYSIGLFLLALIVSGCTAEPEPDSGLESEDKLFIVEGELPSSPPANEWILEAVTDLAARLEVAPGEITFVNFELVVWPDSSYGCPQPGTAYQQVEKEGYKVVLRAAGRLYAYHAGEDRELFLCENE